MDEPGLIDSLADEYARISVHIERPDGSVEEGPVGMFMVDPPKERWVGGHDEWVYAGSDMLRLLDTFMFRGQAVLPTEGTEVTVDAARGLRDGESYRAALVDVLSNPDPGRGMGLAQTQFSFSGAMNQVAAGDLGWEGGTSALTIVTEILEGAGWRKPWVTPQGVITSAPAGDDPSVITPSLVLATGDNSRLRWPFEVDPDASAVGNRVRVLGVQEIRSRKYKRAKKKKKMVPAGWSTKRNLVQVWATNDDPSHPLSFQRLNRWIDIPDVKAPLLQTVSEAQQLARQALIDAGQLPIRVRLTTEIMVRGLNEVYDLDMYDATGEPIESGQGRYFCRGWSLQLGPPWEMVHSLSRVIPFEEASFL
jgi:hypothetical protein